MAQIGPSGDYFRLSRLLAGNRTLIRAKTGPCTAGAPGTGLYKLPGPDSAGGGISPLFGDGDGVAAALIDEKIPVVCFSTTRLKCDSASVEISRPGWQADNQNPSDLQGMACRHDLSPAAAPRLGRFTEFLRPHFLSQFPRLALQVR